MNINLSITLTASPELLALLQALVNGSSAAPKPAKAAKESKLSAVTTEEKTAEEKPTEKISAVTLADVRAVAVPLSKAGHKDVIKKKITELGAESLDKLPTEHFGAFLEFLNSLKS